MLASTLSTRFFCRRYRQVDYGSRVKVYTQDLGSTWRLSPGLWEFDGAWDSPFDTSASQRCGCLDSPLISAFISYKLQTGLLFDLSAGINLFGYRISTDWLKSFGPSVITKLLNSTIVYSSSNIPAIELKSEGLESN